MAYYVDKFNGYIVDVANLDFIRCDGTPFSYDKATATSLTDTSNNLTITGGQGRFPLAFIDTDRALEITFTSAQFTMDMFEMANTTTATDADYGVYETGKFEVKEGTKVVLPFEAQATSIKIRGLKYSSSESVTTGMFAVKNTAASGTYGEEGYTAPSTEITFATGDVAIGDEVRITYKRRIANAHVVSVKTTTTTARGELVMHFPIYSDGTDCTQANIKGWLHIRVPRVRCTSVPGVDSSYKTNATPSVTFASMDAQRSDKNMYDIVYEELDANGEYVTNYSGTMTWNN